MGIQVGSCEISKFNEPYKNTKFRSNRNGTNYWINPDTFVTRKQYPFLKEGELQLKTHIYFP